MVHLKRAYEAPSRSDGKRILVDRLWPRGLAKDRAKLDGWIKEIAPSTELRKWFGHDPERWDEFQSRYREELRSNPVALAELRALARAGTLTLVYSARDPDHNNAVVLKQVLEARSARRRAKTSPRRARRAPHRAMRPA